MTSSEHEAFRPAREAFTEQLHTAALTIGSVIETGMEIEDIASIIGTLASRIERESLEATCPIVRWSSGTDLCEGTAIVFQVERICALTSYNLFLKFEPRNNLVHIKHWSTERG